MAPSLALSQGRGMADGKRGWGARVGRAKDGVGKPVPAVAGGGRVGTWMAGCTWWVVEWDSGSVRVRGVAATRSKTTWSSRLA